MKVLLALDLSWEQYDAVFRFINTSRNGVISAKEFVTAFDNPGEFNELRLGAGQRDVLGEESRKGGKKRRPRTGSSLARSLGKQFLLMLPYSAFTPLEYHASSHHFSRSNTCSCLPFLCHAKRPSSQWPSMQMANLRTPEWVLESMPPTMCK